MRLMNDLFRQHHGRSRDARISDTFTPAALGPPGGCVTMLLTPTASRSGRHLLPADDPLCDARLCRCAGKDRRRDRDEPQRVTQKTAALRDALGNLALPTQATPFRWT